MELKSFHERGSFNSHGRMIGREIVHAGKRKVSPASFLPSIVDQRSGKLIIVHEGASRRLLVTACPASSRRLEGPLLSFPLSLPLSWFDELTLVDPLILSAAKITVRQDKTDKIVAFGDRVSAL